MITREQKQISEITWLRLDSEVTGKISSLSASKREKTATFTNTEPEFYCFVTVDVNDAFYTPELLDDLMTSFEVKGYGYMFFLHHQNDKVLKKWLQEHESIPEEKIRIVKDSIRSTKEWESILDKYEKYCEDDYNIKKHIEKDWANELERQRKNPGAPISQADFKNTLKERIVDALCLIPIRHESESLADPLKVLAFFDKNDHLCTQDYAMKNAAAILGDTVNDKDFLLCHVKYELEPVTPKPEPVAEHMHEPGFTPTPSIFISSSPSNQNKSPRPSGSPTREEFTNNSFLGSMKVLATIMSPEQLARYSHAFTLLEYERMILAERILLEEYAQNKWHQQTSFAGTNLGVFPQSGGQVNNNLVNDNLMYVDKTVNPGKVIRVGGAKK